MSPRRAKRPENGPSWISWSKRPFVGPSGGRAKAEGRPFVSGGEGRECVFWLAACRSSPEWPREWRIKKMNIINYVRTLTGSLKDFLSHITPHKHRGREAHRDGRETLLLQGLSPAAKRTWSQLVGRSWPLARLASQPQAAPPFPSPFPFQADHSDLLSMSIRGSQVKYRCLSPAGSTLLALCGLSALTFGHCLLPMAANGSL